MNNEENNNLNPMNLGNVASEPVNPQMVGEILGTSQMPASNAQQINPVPMNNVDTLNGQMPINDVVQNQNTVGSGIPSVNQTNVVNQPTNVDPYVTSAAGMNEVPMQDMNQVNSAVPGMPVNPNDVYNAQTMPMNDSLINDLNAPQTVVVPDQESVGEIPPNKPEKKGMNKILFVILIVVLIGGVAYGVYYFLTMTQNTSSVTTKNLTYNIYDEIPSDINSYADFSNVSSDNCNIDLSNVDNSIVGDYTYTITCDVDTYTGIVSITDSRSLTVVAKEAVFIKGHDATGEDLIESCGKENCYYEIENEGEFYENLKVTGGPYYVNVTVSDDSGNSETISTTYYVILAYLNATSESTESENYNATVSVTDRLYIGTENIYMGIAYRNYNYQFNDITEYEAIKEQYENKVEFDGYAGELIFDDDAYTLTVQVSLTEETLDLEYGDTFPVDYAEIKSYYEDSAYTVKPVTE